MATDPCEPDVRWLLPWPSGSSSPLVLPEPFWPMPSPASSDTSGPAAGRPPAPLTLGFVLASMSPILVLSLVTAFSSTPFPLPRRRPAPDWVVRLRSLPRLDLSATPLAPLPPPRTGRPETTGRGLARGVFCFQRDPAPGRTARSRKRWSRARPQLRRNQVPRKRPLEARRISSRDPSRRRTIKDG